MKGLELSKKFYIEHGLPMLKEQFEDVLPFLAAGLTGSGSECFGFDDEISRDHDFEPGFCIFIPDEDLVDSRTAFRLERAYAKLPKEFMGYKRAPLSPVGGNRHGVIRIGDFFEAKCGSKRGKLSVSEWFTVPEQSLAEAVNGEIFFDNYGLFTNIRKKLAFYPEDIKLKKLAGNLLIMGQSGQYNYPRCISRGDTAAAQLSIIEFVSSAMNAVFLINETYIPYYKWSFRALKELDILSELSESLEYLISSENGKSEALKKSQTAENICDAVITQIKALGLTDYNGASAEGHAYSVNDRIKDNTIRNMHILCFR